MRNIFLALTFIAFSYHSFSQGSGGELLCTTTIIDYQIQVTDKSVFRTLEKEISNFMNGRNWTNEKFDQNEKIECNIQIILNTYDPKQNPAVFQGSAQIQSRRPIYGTAYNSVAFNINDENWNFEYMVNSPSWNYNENGFTSDLVSLLSFYAYYIIGTDFDSYGLYAGTPYFSKAFQIANYSQSSAKYPTGWQPFERNIRSRYNLADNVNNERFKPMREANYIYHRQGMDQMLKDPDKARQNIYSSLELVQKIYKIAPNTVMLNVFFESKSDELVNIFKGSPANEKPKVISLLNEINISNTSKYEKIRN